MRRIVVVGNSGAGKSTLARTLAAQLAVPHVELDALFHQPGWRPREIRSFQVAAWEALNDADREADGWVVCGNYSRVRATVWARADTVVWLDLPRSVVMPRIVRRSLRRVITGEELWNGNRESWPMLLSLHDRQRSILRWSWDQSTPCRERYLGLMRDPLWADLRWHRLRTRREISQFAAEVAAANVAG
ncbi:MAG: shikimate kinase [Candidatus Nanopelagicales bacterium]